MHIINITVVLTFVLAVPIRLVGTNYHYYGRVEVYHNGIWGTVCDDGWDNTDATVVCRQLGFYFSPYAYGSAQYGQGTGPIWLSNISCIGNESSLVDCSQSSAGTNNCTHSDDAAVSCDSYYYYYYRYYNYRHIRCELLKYNPVYLNICIFN